jgi:hypothetical protein
MVRRRRSARKKTKRTVYDGLGGAAPARRGGAWVLVVLAGLVVVNLYVFVWNKNTGVAAIRRQAENVPMAMPSAPLAPPDAPSPAPAVPAPPEIVGKVGKSDTLGRVLRKNGLSAGDADAVIRALSGVLDFRTIRAGQTFRIARRGDGSVARFELDLGKGRRAIAERSAGGELVGSTAE